MLSSSDSTTLALWLNSQTSPHTRSCYRRDADRLLAHVSKPLSDIGLGDLQDFSESLIAAGLAPVSRVCTLAAVKSLFGFCCRTRHLPANPAAELTLPVYEQRLAERIIVEEDVAKLLAADAAPRDQFLLRLIYGAGLRVFRRVQSALAERSATGKSRSNYRVWEGRQDAIHSDPCPVNRRLVPISRRCRRGSTGVFIEKRETAGQREGPHNPAIGR